MPRSQRWILIAALFTSFLGGCATEGAFSGGTVPPSTSNLAGTGDAAASPMATPPHSDILRGRDILRAPSVFHCRGEGANEDVFEEQCEAETRTND
jgi:hypothetical protein